MALGAREYGARFGIRRLLDVLDRHDVKATVIASGLVAELFPESVREVRVRGHELATHGWDQSMHPPVFKTKDEEKNSIAKSITAIEQASKERIVGYMSQGPRPTPNTLEICTELGFVWTADYSDSDVPYVIDVNGLVEQSQTPMRILAVDLLSDLHFRDYRYARVVTGVIPSTARNPFR